MEQLNNALPEIGEENQPAAEVILERKEEPLLLSQVRQKFGIFGGISLIFGGLFTLFFYRAWIGLNVVLFTAAIIILLGIAIKKLSMPIKKGTKLYLLGALLLSVSTALTASGILQFLNIIGILLLLDLSLLHQFYENRHWDFTKHFCRMFGLLFQSIASIWMPFVDMTNFMKRTKLLKNDKVRNTVLGALLSIPFLIIITALLSSADLLFANATDRIINVLFSSEIIDIGFLILFGFLACYCILCGTMRKTGIVDAKDRQKADASIAITFMGLLCLLYAFFCGIQLIYLFANGLFVLPEGYTFAEYARRGFFELLAVTVINIVIMLLISEFFKESRILRLLITCMTVCTYIMIASATYRMLLYIGAYHLTFLRLFVLLALLIDALVLAGVLASTYHKSFPLFRYCVAVVTVCYLAFSLSKPDYFIASYLIDQNELLDAEDIDFLTNNLSKDAAGVVLPMLADQDRWTMGDVADENNDRDNHFYQSAQYCIGSIKDYYEDINRMGDNHDIRNLNLSNISAVRYAKKYSLEQLNIDFK